MATMSNTLALLWRVVIKVAVTATIVTTLNIGIYARPLSDFKLKVSYRSGAFPHRGAGRQAGSVDL